MAVVFASVPPEVKMISCSEAAPISAATAIRALRSPSPACAPKPWPDEALPKCSVK